MRPLTTTPRAGVLCLAAAAALFLAPSPLGAQLQTLTITKLADGVYGAIYSDMIRDPVQSNALIVIGGDGVLVVDAHYTPAAARDTIAEIRKLTPLPVRYVVTTHWHDDHVFGNQEYLKAFPGVEFVAQTQTRVSMVASAGEHQRQLVAGYGNAVARREQQLKTGTGADGKPLSAEERADVQLMLPIARSYLEEFKAVSIVLPTVTFDRDITLHLGDRDVDVRSFGPGNTKGDAVIYLPKEKIAAVGDLVVYPVPFIYGGYPVSWVNALKQVRALGVETIVPGHGPVMRDFTYIDQVSALLQAMADQARDAVARGLSLDEARKTFDLSKEHDRFVAGRTDEREGTWQASIMTSGIEAAYKEAQALKTSKAPR